MLKTVHKKKLWITLAVRVAIPTFMSVLLFTFAVFALIIPMFEEGLLVREKNCLQHLTQTAWSVLNDHNERVQSGELSLEEAQHLATERIRRMRYGHHMKDYFWINDLTPRMILHPYRPDLEGTNLSDYEDPDGERLFVESVQIAESKETHGFIDYLWQLRDNPDHVVDKLSHVRLFKPWGWIIGTGTYLDELARESRLLKNRLVTSTILILALVTVLSLFVIWQSYLVEHERRTAQAALYASEEQLRLALEGARDGVWDWDIASGEISYSERLASVLQWPTEKLRMPVEEWRAQIHKGDIDLVLELLNKHLRGESTHFEAEYRMTLSDGSHKWVLSRGRVVERNDGGAPSRVAGAILDITERKQAEQALRESEERYRSLVETMRDGLAIQSVDGVFTYINDRICEMFGRPREEIIGVDVIEFLTPESAQAYQQRITKGTDQFTEPYEITIIRPDNSEVIALVAPQKLFDSQSGYGGSFGVVTDITDWRRAQETIREREATLRSIFRASPVGIGMVVDRVFKHVNDRVCEMTGYKQNELLGQSARMIYPDDSEYQRVGRVKYEDIQRTGVGTIETHWRQKDGTIIDVLLSSCPIDISDLTLGVTFTALDITARKQVDAEKRKLEGQLRQSQKMDAVGQLAGGVAHDFNNHLTAVLGGVELVASALKREELNREVIEERLADIEEAVKRAATLTRQLLMFSRKDIGQPEILNLSQVARDFAKMLGRLLPENVRLALKLSDDIPSIEADAGQIEQVIMNVVLNARDAMPDGGTLVVETSDVWIDNRYAEDNAVSTPGHHVMLAISDTGHGMDQDTLERIFEPFFTTKPMGRGTGLGLSTVYGIIKQAGGHIMVYSEPDRGTTFKIYLPAVETPSVVAQRRQAEEAIQGGNENILLCEDDAMVRQLVEQMLLQAGYSVHTAANGQEAHKIFDEFSERFDLLISDIIMPDTNGKKLAEELCGKQGYLKTLFVSGYTANVIVHHGVLDEGVEFLPKPFSRRTLLKRVRNVLDKVAPEGSRKRRGS